MLAHKPIALRQIGPKCAFFTNRAIEAFDETPQRSLKRKAPPPLPSPPVETRGLVSTLPALLEAEGVTSEEAKRRCRQSLKANQDLGTIVAVDELREAIAKTIKDMHSGAPCLYRHLTFAVLIMFMQRGIPKRAMRVLVHKRYRVFDVKMLYYGDFKGRTVHVADRDAGWKTGTIIAYHPFDGFVAERWVGDSRERFQVTHDTDWVWGTAHKKSNI